MLSASEFEVKGVMLSGKADRETQPGAPCGLHLVQGMGLRVEG